MKAGIYIGKNKHKDTLLIRVHGESPFLKVDFWNISVLDSKVITDNANSKQISQIDWDNVKLIEE